MAQILDGKKLNEKIAKKLKAEISRLRSKPKLVIIQVGDLPESNAYIGRKVKFGEKIGAIVEHKRFPEKITLKELQTMIYKLNTDTMVHGVIVQMPLPKHIDRDEIIDSIEPAKDVDGLTSRNLKLLWENSSSRHPEHSEGSRDSSSSTQNDKGVSQGFIPATTKGVITLLDEYKIPIEGKHVVVIGRSFLVGKPTFLAFLNRDATVTVCHRHTKDLAQITKSADILVVATGKPNLIGKEHVSKNQVVIDVGINVINQPETRNQKPETEISGRKLVGDVNFEEVSKIVKAISPVPGGAGPMTVASLFENLLEAYIRQT